MLESLCRTMEDDSLDRVIACIHPLDEEASMFLYAAAPSFDKSYGEAVKGMLVSSITGPCCHAISTRQTVIVPEVAADSRCIKFREFAEPLGIRSAWCTPIFSKPPSRKEAAWDWPSAAPLSSRMAGICGQAPTVDVAQLFISLYRSRSRSRHLWLPKELLPLLIFRSSTEIGRLQWSKPASVP